MVIKNGKCIVQWLNSDKNYILYNSIQDFFKVIQMDMIVTLKYIKIIIFE
jgi:hypothetical protein